MAMLQLALLFLAMASQASADVFTALVDLENVIYTESNMVQAIKNYVKGEEEKLESIKRQVERLEKTNREAVSDPEHYLGHPVNSYLLVKRFLWEWAEIENLVRLDKPKTEYLVNITQYREYMPDGDDLNGAASALLRLQDTYRLDTATIASGQIQGTWTTPQLTAHECFELGRVAYNANDHYHTILWMREAMRRREKEEKPQVDRATLLDYLAWAIYQEGEMKEALKYTEELLQLDPTHERAQNNKAFFEYHMKEEARKKRGDLGDVDEDEQEKTEEEVQTQPEEKTEPQRDENGEFKPTRPADHLPERLAYEALCRGEEEYVKVFTNPKQMKCSYQHYNHPLLILQPAKEDVIFLKPKLIMYRDIVNDKEISLIKGIASPRLNRATIQNSVTGNLEYADYRISKSAWLKEEEHETIARIRRRVSAITNLDLATAEELQVVNYGIGGHYEPHFDFARKEETNAFKSLGTGNRIATMLFYFSDVEAGGATVFPKVGARVIPTKGSGAFWYNLHPNGQGNYDTRHAACPVLAGSKWVANIWIHEQGQEFRRKCGLDEHKY